MPYVVEEILKAAHFSGDDFAFMLQQPHAEHDYLEQYHETDLAFISRLLAEEGIWSFHDHSDERHTLILTDTETVDRPVSHAEDGGEGGGLIHSVMSAVASKAITCSPKLNTASANRKYSNRWLP